MTTQAWFYENGKKVLVPSSPLMAQSLGWHLGGRYTSPVHADPEYDQIIRWCREMFNHHDYCVFMTSVWFRREQDAMLCQLRWA